MAIPGSRQNRPGGSGSQDKRGYPRSKDEYAPPERRPAVSSREDSPAAPAPVPESATEGSSGAFTNQDVRELVKLVHDNDITELVVERDSGAQRLVIKRDRPAPAPVMLPHQVTGLAQLPPQEVPMSMATNPAPGTVITDPGAPPQDSFHKVIAPMVGTFYRGPDPKETPFVQEGDMVERDQVIGIIEAMKIMNEIKSDHRGRCVRISVENGQPVEYGQTLMLLEPA